ncbi:MAG TPA: iron-containing alcohol dehydrogenase [Candidatus Dormibacteraeota bacterium]|nr:iron-containing alcohol dehydrogenase [Candidatus Dormibacteraeota bacterium]
MPVFQYANPPRIVWGAGSVRELPTLAPGRVALVTTRSLLEAPLPIDPALKVAIGQHAPIAQVDGATERARAAGVDGVVSFGGGSPIDAAKIVALKLGLPHVAVPTTLSVAELAAGAGFTDATGTKGGMRDPGLMPAAVIYDAELTLKTPAELWLSTGIRALDHAIEGFLAEGEHPFNDVMALEAIRRLFRVLPATKADPANVGCRTDCQLAAWFSFTLPGASASGLSHVMGKQIGARHGIPHGVTSCLLLPHVMRYLETRQPSRVHALGVTPDEVEGLIGDLGLPLHIAAYSVGDADLRRAADELAGKYPAADLLQIYTSAL